MQLKWKIVLFFLVAILFSHCSKDVVVLPNQGEECVDLPSTNNLLGYQYQQPEVGYSAPCFNPSNPNEIIFVRGHYSAQYTELVKYNFSTKNEQILLNSSQIWGYPDWGINGWILLNKGDNQVWKIKDNGDSLTQLTSQFGLDAVWSPNGDEFAYWVQIGSTYYTFFSDVNGNVFDTLLYPNIIYRNAWSPDGNKIATNFTYNLSYINLISKQTIQAYNSPNTAPINSMDWFPDSKTIVWCSYDGVFKTNINTYSTIQIKTGCTSRSYIWPSVAANGSKIIVQRYDSKLIAENTVWIESNLYMMDANGNNETKLTFP